MTEPERKFIFLGSFENGLPDTFEIPMAPLQKIEQQLDAEKATEARAQAVAIADIERAMAMRRVQKAFKMFARMK